MSTTVATTPLTNEQLVDRYVRLRDKLALIKKAHASETNRYAEAMGAIEGLLIQSLQAANANSMNTDAGTFYMSTKVYAKVTDWPAVLAWVKEHNAWDLLTASVSKTALEAIIEETKQPVPGVEVTREHSLNVRRA